MPRSGDHTATLLMDGSVLVVGGATCGAGCGATEVPVNSAELFDPVARRWTPTSPMSFPREYHTATLLPNGSLLVVGGAAQTTAGDFGGFSNTAELWSPLTGRWTTVSAMHHPRLGHTATLLPSGRVLVAGGTGAGPGPLAWEASTELFDPATGRWTDGPPMNAPRADHTATLLSDGRVLVAGGRDGAGEGVATALSTAELYDPVRGSWALIPQRLHAPRTNLTATLLDDGTVLIVGGAAEYLHGGTAKPTGSVEIFHPDTRTLTEAPPLLAARLAHTATRLQSGEVLVVGGLLEGDNVRTHRHRQAVPEIFNPRASRWVLGSPMPGDPNTHGLRRDVHIQLAGNPTATLLRDGTVLVIGGDDAAHSAQLFDPAAAPPSSSSSSSVRAVLGVGVGAAAVAVVVVLAVLALRRRSRGPRFARGGGFR